MDDDYTYDEMCPEEAEFIHSEGGESLADDSNYMDDYVHHSIMGQPNYNGDNTDFAHHAALYGAYLASIESDSKTGDGSSANESSSATDANTNDSQSGCLIFAVLIIVIALVMYFII